MGEYPSAFLHAVILRYPGCHLMKDDAALNADFTGNLPKVASQ
jgi:hypothetical protein